MIYMIYIFYYLKVSQKSLNIDNLKKHMVWTCIHCLKIIFKFSYHKLYENIYLALYLKKKMRGFYKENYKEWTSKNDGFL